MRAPPHRGEWPDDHRVDQLLCAQLIAKHAVIVVGGIAQHHARHLGGDRGADLRRGNLVLGHEVHRRGYANIGAALRIVGHSAGR